MPRVFYFSVNSDDIDEFIVSKFHSFGSIELIVNNSGALTDVEKYTQTGGINTIDCIVLKSSDAILLDALLQLLSSPFLYKKPRIIFISSILTWCGKSSSITIRDADEEFSKRQPCIGYLEEFVSENKIFAIRQRGFDACIIGRGLLYGGSGLDFESFLISTWESRTNFYEHYSSLPAIITKAKIPMIHKDDYAGLIIALTCHPEPLSRFYYSASDGNLLSLYDTLEGIRAKALEPPNLDEVGTLSNILSISGSKSLVNFVSEVKNFALYWKTDLCFENSSFGEYALQYPQGLINSFAYIWNEFQVSRSLSPCRVFIVGAPFSIQSRVSSALSDTLKVPLVTTLTAVKYFIETVALTGDLLELQSALVRELEAISSAAVDPKAKGKKPAEEVTFDIKTVCLTDQMVGSLPRPLQIRCLKAYISSERTCIRRGYVIDAWNTSIYDDSDLFSLADSTFETASGTMSAMGISEQSLGAQLRPVVDCFIEIQDSDEKVTEAFMSKNGIDSVVPAAKRSKDQQALLTSFEATLNQYNSKVTEIASGVGGNLELGEVPAEITNGTGVVIHSSIISAPKGHELFTRIQRSAANMVIRLDASAYAEDDIPSTLLRQLIEFRGKPIGWLSAMQDATINPPEENETVETLGLVGEEKVEIAINTAAIPGEAYGEECTLLVKDGEFAGTAVDAPVYEGSSTGQSLEETISALDEQDRISLYGRSEKLKDFCIATVLPCITKIMVAIVREKPADPLKYMMDALQTEGELLENNARLDAKIVFDQILAASTTSNTS